jgi:hypothetical protein
MTNLWVMGRPIRHQDMRTHGQAAAPEWVTVGAAASDAAMDGACAIGPDYGLDILQMHHPHSGGDTRNRIPRMRDPTRRTN